MTTRRGWATLTAKMKGLGKAVKVIGTLIAERKAYYSSEHTNVESPYVLMRKQESYCRVVRLALDCLTPLPRWPKLKISLAVRTKVERERKRRHCEWRIQCCVQTKQDTESSKFGEVIGLKAETIFPASTRAGPVTGDADSFGVNKSCSRSDTLLFSMGILLSYF